MDTDDINTAQKIWKWGIGGLAYSSTGVNGTWTTGITMDGYIVGSMISANSIVGEQIQANTIKASNLEIATQEKIKNATDVQTVDTMIKAGLGEFEVNMSKNFVTVENATSQIQQATEVAVKEATQNIIDNAVSESLESVNEQLNGKLNDYTDDILTPAIQNKAEEILNNANNYTIEKLSTYATKSEVSSGIKQAIDNINLSVSEKYETKEQSEIKIKEAINDVAIGSVNRVLGSSETKSHQFKGGSNETWVAYDMISDFSDNTVTVSFKYKFVGTVENGSRLLFQSQFTDNSNVIKYQPTYTLIDATSYKELNVTDEVVFTTKEFTNMNKGLRSKFRFRADGMTGTLTISEAQLKIGNKITEWSIAPEDIINTSEDFVVKQLTNYSTKSETKSAIDLVKDEINLGVSSLYETKANVETQIRNVKTELNTSIGKKANSVDVYNKTEVYTKSQTDSAIKIAKDSIDLSVKSLEEEITNVETTVNAISVGGRNLIKKKSGFTYGYLSASDGVVTNTGSLNTNQDFYTNDYIFVKGGTPITFTAYPKQGVTSNIQGAVYIHFYNTNKVWQWCKNNITNVNQKASVTYTTVSDCYVRFCARGFNDYEHMAEFSTKPSQWTPAPEDITTDITTAKNDAITSANGTLTTTIKNYYTKTETDSQIKVAKDSINLGVSQTYETKTNVTSKVNGAISTASSDATTKANNALSSAKSYADTKKTEAINSANNTLNTTIANYYTKSQTDSQIDVAKNAITQSVSNTYETKTNVQNKIDAIKIGGTNLIKKKSGFTYGYLSSSNGSVNNSGSLNTNQDFYTNDYYSLKKGETICFTSYVKQNVSSSIKAAVFIHIYNTSKVWQKSEYRDTNTANVNANKIYTAEYDCYVRFCARGFNDYNHKAEYGTKYTDYSPASEDMETTVSNLTQRVTTAESKITDTAITNVVKQNFYTKTETNNQITSKGYQTSSQVQQTVDALQLKFTQSGGYNRIRNGIFKNGTSQWSSWGSPTISTKTDTGHSYGKSLVLTTTANNQGVQQIVSDLCSGKTYTLSAYVYTWAANDCGIQIACGGSYYSAKVPSSGSWQRISVTFKATATTATVQIGRGGWGANGQHLFTAIQFEEGELATTYTPHPSEIYDGITTIDKDGITVTGSNSAYTNFNSLGMNSYNNSGQQTLGIRNGGITFHPYSNNQLGAYITQSALWNGSASANGLAISTANNGTYISLGTSSLSDANTTLNMDQALTVSANDNFQPKGINLWKDTHAHGYGIRQLSHLRLAGSGAIQFDYLNTSPSTIYEAVDGGHSLYVMGGYQTHIGCMDGEGTPKGVIWMQNSTNTHSYTHWNFHNYTMYNMKTATSYANTLSRKVNEVYGVNSNVEGIRYLYKNVELANGKAVRSIPSAYVGCDYDIVSIVCKGKGSAWVELENNDNFQINGECKAVNVEIIIYPKDEVMTMCSVNCTESPKLTLPNEVNGEVAPLISNYIGDDN